MLDNSVLIATLIRNMNITAYCISNRRTKVINIWGYLLNYCADKTIRFSKLAPSFTHNIDIVNSVHT